MEAIVILAGVVFFFIILLVLAFKNLYYVCTPSQVLIFSGSRTSVAGKVYGYRLIKGGSSFRKPFIEKVDMIDVSNMIIDLQATNAYVKGGVPVNVVGVANVKIASHEPLINNAIERFLGKTRAEIMAIAKATLEGSLRGVLATLTPEQLNEDRNLFAERLVQEVENDMTTLGLVVDTLKIQNITDDVKYLDSIGRTRNADLLSSARVAEAIARADSMVRTSENNEREVFAQIQADTQVAQASAQMMLTDALTQREAVVAEENAQVFALVAKARADVEVQKARIEQIRGQLEADVIQPAKAACEAAEQNAKAEVAPVVEDGRARAEALRSMAKSWNDAGDEAREIILLQKIEPVIEQITAAIGNAPIEKMTMITSSSSGGMDSGKLLGMAEQIKEVFGIDVVDKLQRMGESKPTPVTVEVVNPAPAPIEQAPDQYRERHREQQRERRPKNEPPPIQ